MGYAFNWSPEGVVNEYLNDCEVIEDGTRKWVSSMEWHELLYVEGVALEAFTTSGGLSPASARPRNSSAKIPARRERRG